MTRKSDELAAKELAQWLDALQASDELPLPATNLSTEEINFMAELTQLAGTTQPDESFTRDLEKHLQESPQRGTIIRFAVWPRSLSTIAAALILVMLATLTITPLRVMAQDFLDSLFNRTANDTELYETPRTVDIAPTPQSDAQIWVPNTDIEKMKAEAGFHVKVPTYLPEGYELVDADPGINQTSLFYSRRGFGISIIQRRVEDAEPFDVGASAEIITVQIGDATAQFVKGCWYAVTEENDDTREYQGRTWAGDCHAEQMRWIDDGMVFWMSSVIGSGTDLSLEEWIAIAESLE